MNRKLINPYRPGAGIKPVFLAGRDNEINDMSDIFDALKNNIPVQSIVYSGLRGVGKTVLLNELEHLANEKDIYSSHIEIEDRKDFISQIVSCAQIYIRNYSFKDKFGNIVNKTIDAIKSLNITYSPSDSSFSLSVQDRDLYYSTNLIQPLTDMLTSVGELAEKNNVPVCFFIDEIQYIDQDELGALIAAIHRTNQLGYPLMIVCVGLPKIYTMLSKAKSYSERLFMYKTIGSLDKEYSNEAIIKPAAKFDVTFDDKAVEKIYDLTKGYPFFIQQFCKIIFDKSTDACITEADVLNCVDDYNKELDNGFFEVRYQRCSAGEKLFIFAMVKCGDLPCTISNVAKNLNTQVKSISPIRAQLINKGIIYPTHYKEIDFTVPDFDLFINRKDEYQNWLEETK